MLTYNPLAQYSSTVKNQIFFTNQNQFLQRVEPFKFSFVNCFLRISLQFVPSNIYILMHKSNANNNGNYNVTSTTTEKYD